MIEIRISLSFTLLAYQKIENCGVRLAILQFRRMQSEVFDVSTLRIHSVLFAEFGGKMNAKKI